MVSRRWMWMESMGVGGCKKVYIHDIVYRFPHITYPYSSCICSFLQQHPIFVHLKNVFRSCSGTFFKLNFMY